MEELPSTMSRNGETDEELPEVFANYFQKKINDIVSNANINDTMVIKKWMLMVHTL